MIRLLFWVVLASVLSACMNTTRFASEYSRQYYLAEDVHLYQSYAFTGLHSLWLTGPEDVETICSARIPVAKSTTIRKGSRVRILKLFQTAAIDSSSSEAKLELIDRDSKAAHVVYVKWPGSKRLLTTEAP